MKKKLVSLVLVATMALSMVACGNKAATTENPASTGEAPEVATTKEDKTTLNIWMSSEPAHIDPALNSSVDGGCLAVNSFEGLMRYNEKGELEPACAESYEVSEDGLTYTFTMRDGLKWSNGDELTAKDFVYSWKRAASPEVAADYSYLAEIFPSFTYEEGLGDGDVVASEDGKTLTVTLGAVCPYFLDLCAFPFFFPVNEKAVEASKTGADDPVGAWANDAGDNFVCNGAYVLSSWNHDSDMTYVKNDNYWDADSVSVTTLNVMLTAENTVAYTAYQTGDLDFIDDIPVAEMEVAKTSPEYVVLDNLGTYYASFNYNTGLYKDLGLDEDQAAIFRHAITLLIDRQYIIDTVAQNNQVAATSFIPAGCSDGNGGEFKNKDYYGTDYDANVEEAKSLLESIGLFDTASDSLTKDISLTYLTNNSEGNVKIGECIQADLATVGINLTIDQEEWNVFQETRKAGKYDFAREGWIMDYNDPINMLEMYTTNSGNNNPQFGKDSSKKLDWSKYDDMISGIRKEADLAARADLMHEAEDYLMDTWCIIPIYYYNDPYMIKDYVKGVYGTVEGMKYFYHATIN